MDITKFCAPNDGRHYLHKPMRHEGFLYATTGHIAVRIADDPAIDAEPMPQNLQNSILQKMATDTEERIWSPAPPIGRAGLRDCPHCSGSGRARTCPACAGDGEFEHYGDWYGCKHCDETGQITAQPNDNAAECYACLGSGIDANESIEISGVHIAARLLHLISAEIPDAEIGISNNPMGPQLLRAPGVIGVVMPMRP